MAFHGFLRQSTATTLNLGPFVDATDGVTPETALTISASDVQLWKEGGTTSAAKNDATACTHRQNGDYTCPVNATDTGTLGMLTARVNEGGALQVRQDYMVIPQTTYDILFANGIMTLFTTQLTEAYRANGAAPTMAQFACESLAHDNERSISGTTETLKKFDHTTTALTRTLNSATEPSSRTRAT